MKQPPDSLHRLKLHIRKCNYIVTTNGSQGVGTEKIVWQNGIKPASGRLFMRHFEKLIPQGDHDFFMRKMVF